MSEQPTRSIKRILVALDTSLYSLAALDLAVDLAADLQADLEGLYVEDINLLYMADLPFTREVRLLSAVADTVTRRYLEGVMRQQAASLRRALLQACERVEIPGRFRVVRGRIPQQVLQTALDENTDLLVLGRAGEPLTRRRRSGSTARTVAVDSPRSVLLVQRRLEQNEPLQMLITYDGTPAARQALETAANLAPEDALLTLLLLSDDPAVLERWQTDIAGWLSAQERTATFQRLKREDIADLVWMVEATHANLLVLGGETVPITEETIQELLDGTDCSLLIVRE